MQLLCQRTLSARRATAVDGMVCQRVARQLLPWSDSYPDDEPRYTSAQVRRSHCGTPHPRSAGTQFVTKPIWYERG